MEVILFFFSIFFIYLYLFSDYKYIEFILLFYLFILFLN